MKEPLSAFGPRSAFGKKKPKPPAPPAPPSEVLVEELVRKGATLRSEAVVLEKAVRTGDHETVHRVLGLMDDRALIADKAGDRDTANGTRAGRVELAKATGIAPPPAAPVPGTVLPVGAGRPMLRDGAAAASRGWAPVMEDRTSAAGAIGYRGTAGLTLQGSVMLAQAANIPPLRMAAAVTRPGNAGLTRAGYDLSPRFGGASHGQPVTFGQPTPLLDPPASLVPPLPTLPQGTGYDLTVPSLEARPFNDGVYSTFGLTIGHSFGGTYGEQATAAAQPFQNIVIHHSTGGHNLAGDVDYGHRIDPARNPPGAYGYHFYIGPDGTIVQGAPMWARTNGAPGYGVLRNANSIHVAMTGDQTNYTPEQIAAATALVQALAADYDINAERIVNHGNLDPTRDEARNPAIWQILENVGALDDNVLRPGNGAGIFEPDDRVMAVQMFLGSISRADGGTPGLLIDGDYGDGTLAAVRRFQAEYGLLDTGFVDRATQRAILDYAMSHGIAAPGYLGGQ